MTVTTTYQITGMTCGHCVNAVSTELSSLPGVREVQVDLDSGTATVTSEDAISLDQVRTAVDEAGYSLG